MSNRARAHWDDRPAAEAIDELRCEIQANLPLRALGPAEVARALGISRQRLHVIRQAGDFPEPDVMIDGKAGWFLATVERLATLREEGRVPGGAPETWQEVLYTDISLVLDHHFPKRTAHDRAANIAQALAWREDGDPSEMEILVEALSVDWLRPRKTRAGVERIARQVASVLDVRREGMRRAR